MYITFLLNCFGKPLQFILKSGCKLFLFLLRRHLPTHFNLSLVSYSLIHLLKNIDLCNNEMSAAAEVHIKLIAALHKSCGFLSSY